MQGNVGLGADGAIDKLINGIVSASQGTKDVEMFGHTWKFKLLKSHEHLAMINASADQQDSYARIYSVQINTLMAALVTLDDKVLKDDEKRFMFDNVSPSVVEMLFGEYDTFRKEHAAKLAADGDRPAGPIAEPQTTRKASKPSPASVKRPVQENVDIEVG